MNAQILFEESPYTIRKYNGIPASAYSFLERIAWGNEGAVYEHLNTKDHAAYIHKPMLIAIQEGEKIQGTAVFSNTPVSAGEKTLNCYYVRYFASSKEIRGKGIMKRYSRKVMELIREDDKDKTVYFASVERQNKASYKVVESAGYKPAGTIKTLGFSRYFPRQIKGVEKITSKKAKKEILQLLKEQYKDYSLVQFNYLFMKDNYFALREKGEIVAACQYHKAHWVVNNMKGFSGKLIMNIVPLIPVINKIFNPKRFEFLAFEGIYCKEGCEDKLYSLFESLLAKENLRSAMFWLGDNSPLRKKLEAKARLGLIHSFIKDSDVVIMASYKNMSKKEIEDFRSRPLYASAYDYI
jgi:RimJ/RimL family protein N-acetyltransferase